jgi:hypothetical protein
MSTAVKALLACIVFGCSAEVTNSMQVDLHTMSNVDTTGINGITLYLYGTDCTAGPKCDDILKMAMHPRGGMLVPFSETTAQPGQYVHIDPSGLGSACAMLYIEAYSTPGFPGQVMAAGCADVTLPNSTAVVIDMISTTDHDMDGWIGQFNFVDGTHRQGPDCNDNDATIYPGAAELPCTGDHNCDGMATCNKECQSNADCANKPNNAHCCSFAPNWICQVCQGGTTCAESSECVSPMPVTHCCNHTSSMCALPMGQNQCNCSTTNECGMLGAAQCCVSNQNTSADLVPGTCGDVDYWLAHHPQQGFFTEWCRCESSQQCDNLFPSLATQICCVSNRMVCDAPRTGETCL